MPQTETTSESILDQIIERYGDDLDLYILQGFNDSIIGIEDNLLHCKDHRGDYRRV